MMGMIIAVYGFELIKVESFGWAMELEASSFDFLCYKFDRSSYSKFIFKISYIFLSWLVLIKKLQK